MEASELKIIQSLIGDAGFSLTMRESILFDFLMDAESAEGFCSEIESLMQELSKLRDDVKKGCSKP